MLTRGLREEIVGLQAGRVKLEIDKKGTEEGELPCRRARLRFDNCAKPHSSRRVGNSQLSSQLSQHHHLISPSRLFRPSRLAVDISPRI